MRKKVTKIAEGSAPDVREKYRKFYKTRKSNPEWTDNWQDLAGDVHIKKRAYAVNQVLRGKYNSICDLGCGSGDLLSQIRIAGYKGKLIGVDVNLPPRLKQFSVKHNIELHKEDFLKFKGNYDAIIIFSALHFATLAGIPKIIKNQNNCGNFYVIEAYVEHQENAILDEKLSELTNEKCHLYKEANLDKVFEKYGYKVVSKYDFPKKTDSMGRVFTFIHYKTK